MTNKEAIENIKWYRDNCDGDFPSSILQALDLAIKALEEERPKGKWIADDERGNCHCSVCNFENNHQPYFCENCGADMRGDV